MGKDDSSQSMYVKTVSRMLGHYDAGSTLSVCAHATDRMQEEAAEKMGSFMVQSM